MFCRHFLGVGHGHALDRQPQVAAQKAEFRVPAGGRVMVSEAGDGGVSFARLGTGLPQADAFCLIYRHALVVHLARSGVTSTSGRPPIHLNLPPST